MAVWFWLWAFEICIRVVFSGSFDKLCVCKRRWITWTRWVLQCFWYICAQVQFKSDINKATKDVLFYIDLHNFSYASISSPANPPRHPITDKLRTIAPQSGSLCGIWIELRNENIKTCVVFYMILWIQAATSISQNAWFYIVFFFQVSVRSESWESGGKIDGFQGLLVFTILLRQGPAQPALKKIL